MRRLNNTIFSLILLGAAGFYSCMLGPKYKSPELELPSALYGKPDSLTIADQPWWEYYTDPILCQVIAKTLENNKDLLIAAKRIEELALLRRIPIADMLPNATASAYWDQEFENYPEKGHVNDVEVGLKLRIGWEIDLWGNLRWSNERSKAEFMQSVENKRAVEMTLIAEVARSYYELIALDNEYSIVRQTLENRTEGVRQARLRFEGGLTSETSYQQAQVELATTATLIPDLERKISIKESEISLLAGEMPSWVERGRLDSSTDLPDNLPVGLPSELLLRRPDIRASEQVLVASNAAVGIAYTDRFPRLVLTGSAGFEGDELKKILSSPYGLILGNLTSPVFNFGKRKARYKAAIAAYEQENLRYEKKVLSVFKEVSDAIVTYNSIREARLLKSNLQQASRKYVELAHLQYINGVINYIDVLDAQRRYFDAQIGLTNAVRDEYIALVQLYKVLGGGWNPEI